MLDEEELAKQKKAEQLATVQMRDDVRKLMGTVPGRRVVWYLLEQFGIFRTSYSSEALAMAFSEGRRSAGLELMALVCTFCPEQYDKMAREARETNEGNT